MPSIDRITDTTMRGLNIGVLAGVTGGIMKNMNNIFGQTTRRKRRKKRKR